MHNCALPPASPAFGGFVVDRTRSALRRPDGTEVALRPKTFELLAVLAEERGHVVSREALIDAVWPGVVVGDESLTQCVGEVRRALGPGHAAMLRTLPRRGYMLDVPAEAPAAGAAVPVEVPSPPGAARGSWPWWAAGLVGAALALGVDWGLAHRRPPPPPPLPGLEAMPAARVEAVELTRQGIDWFRRERGAGPWRAQRELFRRAAAIDPTLPTPWIYLAFTTANLVTTGTSEDVAGDLAEAAAAARRALELAPRNSDAHAALAAVLRHDPARLDETIAAYREAVALNPAAHPSRANLGWMLVLAGEIEEGERHVRAAIASAPPDHPFRGTWFLQIGMIELMLGRPGHGEEPLRRAFAQHGRGGTASAMSGLAAALARNGAQEEAAYLVRDLLALRPGLTRDVVRDDPFWRSTRPAFREHFAPVLEGLAMAGLD